MSINEIYPFISNNNILLEDLYNDKGVLLLTKGIKISSAHLNIIKKHQLKVVSEVKLQNEIITFNEVKERYNNKVKEISSFFIDINYKKDQAVTKLLDDYKPLIKDILKNHSVIPNLYNLNEMDEYTYKHSVNVGILCSVIGKILNYSDQTIYNLATMGLLHDIGKTKVNQKILNKPSRLTDVEFEEIKKHSLYGYEILKHMDDVCEEAKVGALLHHENLDGSGYPLGKDKKEIPFYVQILSVADRFDAICSKRVYSEGKPQLFAIEELLKDGFNKKINLEIVLPFSKYIMQQQLNEKVCLSNGSIGKIVYFNSDEPSRPLVQINDTFVDLKEKRDLAIVSLHKEEKKNEIV